MDKSSCGCTFRSGFPMPCRQHQDIEGDAVRAALAAWFEEYGARWPAAAPGEV